MTLLSNMHDFEFSNMCLLYREDCNVCIFIKIVPEDSYVYTEKFYYKTRINECIKQEYIKKFSFVMFLVILL